jgi:hypothetical protein
MHTQFHTHDPATTARCAATTRHGLPCHAPALAHSPFCAFHDPSTAEAVAAGRARGGAAPRRRTRRLPRRLDYLQVADLTGELFVEALNYANPADPRSLRAVTQLARVLLHAVGRPKDSYVPPTDDSEPAADAPHLLRVYPPVTSAMEALLAAEASTPDPRGSDSRPPTSSQELGGHDYYFVPEQPMERMEEPPATWLDAVTAAHPAPPLTLEGERGPARAAGPASDALSETDQDLTPAAGLQDGSPADPQAGQPAEQRSGQDPVQGAEQGMDRQWTGHLATDKKVAADLAPTTPPDPLARPRFVLPRSLVYIRRPPRDPFG